ncbi:MAG: GAF domain-containing protein [Chloroflexi bacterium]|nr:GAF domain-containing protein [Chloroflexota bacterium]
MSPPLIAEETDKRKAATITYLVLVLVAASSLLIVSAVYRRLFATLGAVLAGDTILLIFLFLARRGRGALASQVIPLFLFAIATFVVFQGQGIHDITLLSFPMIVALGGLIQGKHGALISAAIGTICFWAVYLGEINGLIPNAIQFREYTSLDDVLMIAVLLWITAAFIHYATSGLTRSLESTRDGEQALRKANESFEHYATMLEQRTGQLLTGARVSRAASSILDPDELSQQVVDMVCKRFGLYYVGLFLMEDGDQWAILHAGTGKAGKQMLQSGHRLKVGNTSMIGWCIAHKKARIALDVGTEAVRFDNPLLPNTRSELALPLISRGEIIGALSIQSEKGAAFSEEDILSFQTMGDQLANAIRNAQLYDELERELAQRRRAEKEIRKLNKELEKRVAARTSDLQAANERLISLSHLKDEFLANVSHELRTPITSIMLYHSMIESNPEKAQQYVRTLKRETNRLAHLIEDLLYLSRLDQGRFHFNPIELDLNRLVQDYATDRAPLAAQRQLTLALEPDEALPPIQADEQMVGQVLSVLLTNALNYTPPNGRIIIRTQAETKQAQAWVGFEVRDTGPGITPEDCGRLFERFFRGKAGRESTAPGTGLGLAIAREIVEKHRGRIEVQSEGPGKGATFSVWLPTSQ